MFSYLQRTHGLELEEMPEYMARYEEDFISRKIIMDEDEVDEGFVVVNKNNIVQILAAKPTGSVREIITRPGQTRKVVS